MSRVDVGDGASEVTVAGIVDAGEVAWRWNGRRTRRRPCVEGGGGYGKGCVVKCPVRGSIESNVLGEAEVPRGLNEMECSVQASAECVHVGHVDYEL